MAGTADLCSTLTQPHSSMSYKTMTARTLKGTFARLPFNLRCARALGFQSRSTPRKPGKRATTHRLVSPGSNDDEQDDGSSGASIKGQESSLQRLPNLGWAARFFCRDGCGSPVESVAPEVVSISSAWSLPFCSLNDPMNYDNLVSPFCFTQL